MMYTVSTAAMKVHGINQMMHNANNPKIQDKPTVQPTVQPKEAPTEAPTEGKQTKPKRKKDNEIVYTMD